MPWFLSHFTALDTRSGEFVGFTPDGRTAIGKLPKAAMVGRLPVPAEQLRVKISLRPAALPPHSRAESMAAMPLHLALTADSQRLIVATADGVWSTGRVGGGHPELERQLRLLARLGQVLFAARGLPDELWAQVLAALLGRAAAATAADGAAGAGRGGSTVTHAVLSGPQP